MLGDRVIIANERFFDTIKIREDLFFAVMENLEYAKPYIKGGFLTRVHDIKNDIDIEVRGFYGF